MNNSELIVRTLAQAGVRWVFGVPSENPKTGKLTAMSIVRAVQDVVDPVRIGN